MCLSGMKYFIESGQMKTKQTIYLSANSTRFPRLPYIDEMIYCIPFLNIFSKLNPLKGQRHEMDIFFEGLNILISTFYDAWMVFKVFQKLFTPLYNYWF